MAEKIHSEQPDMHHQLVADGANDDIEDPYVRSRLARIGGIAAFAASVVVASLSLAAGMKNNRAEAANLDGTATSQIVTNPYSVACPDPDAIRLPGERYTMEVDCTSDKDQDEVGNPNDPNRDGAFSLYKTHNLTDMIPDGDAFPDGHEPWWALKSPYGHYWGPTIQKIGKNYILYFAAQVDPSKDRLISNGKVENGMVLGVAWGRSIHSMYKHTKVLAYTGEFNNVAGNAQEAYGGLIDPTVQKDPENGKIYLAYAEQPNRIMMTTLKSNGLAVNDEVWPISHATERWEGRVEEGPVLYWNKQNKSMDMTINTDSTWRGNYKEAFAESFDPDNHQAFFKYSRPILQSGNGIYGPGMGSKPFSGPNGKGTYVYIHEQIHPNHNEMDRYLALEPFHWTSGNTIDIPAVAIPAADRPKSANVSASPNSNSTSGATTSFKMPVPLIGDGETNKHVVVPFTQRMLKPGLVTLGS